VGVDRYITTIKVECNCLLLRAYADLADDIVVFASQKASVAVCHCTFARELQLADFACGAVGIGSFLLSYRRKQFLMVFAEISHVFHDFLLSKLKHDDV